MEARFKLIPDVSQVRQAIEGLKRELSSRNFAQPLGRISGDASEFKKSLEAATARVTAFGATAGAIYKVSEAIREGARATIEVDKQLVELNTFLGKSRSELEGFSQSLFKVARNASVPFEAASEAAKEFARQGLSANEILKRTEDALTLARISGISYSQAVNGITTAINSFNKEALSSTDIVNKLIAVDTRFAVSSAQLNEALTRVGSSAEESGIGLDKLIATVTAAQQITGRGGAVIGNALKTIFTRLQRPEVLSQLEQLGVAIRDQNGFLLDGLSVLKNYADATKNLSQTEKARTAELIGGIYQINQVNALLKDLSSSNSVYASALKISNAATDEAKRKNEELNKSLSAILQQTKTQAQEAASSLGQPLLAPLVKLTNFLSESLLRAVNPNSINLSSKGEEVGGGLGEAIAKGAVSVLGKSLVTAGGPILAATGGLLAARMIKFGMASLKELGRSGVDIFQSSEDQKVASEYQRLNQKLALDNQKTINRILKQNPDLIQSIQNKSRSLAQVEAIVLDIIKKQNDQLLIQSRIRGRVMPNLAQMGGGKRTFAEGYLPYSPYMEMEEQQAQALGAVNPKAKVIQATIKGKTGPVIVNDKEKVIQNFANTGETAIIPSYRKLEEIPTTLSKGYIPNFSQKISSADTSLNQIPALFKKFGAQLGPRNIDIGGGKYNKGTNFLKKEFGIFSRVHDKYNRSEKFNEETVKQLFGSADTATIANVLNVIEEKPAREELLQFIQKSIKPGGSAYFGIYEGNKSGVGAPTKKGYQRNLPTDAYLEEISKYFNIKKKTGNYVVGSPLASGYVPNFAEGGFKNLSALSFLFKAGSSFSSLINPLDIAKLFAGKGSIESVFRPLIPLMKSPTTYIKSKQDLDSAKKILSTLFSNDALRERGADFLSKIVDETSFEVRDTSKKAEIEALREDFGKKGSDYKGSFLKYRLFGGQKDIEGYVSSKKAQNPNFQISEDLKKNPDGTYRFYNPNLSLRNASQDEFVEVIDSARLAFSKSNPDPVIKKLSSKGKGGQFLGTSFKMGRFIGELGRTRKAIRYQDTWDVDLHQNEKELLENYLNKKSSKTETDKTISKQNFNENYGGNVDSLILRSLVSEITNPVTLKGIVKIPKGLRFNSGYIPNFAKQRLGGGFFGEFFKLRGSLGRKDFFDPKSEITKSNVANEFVAGQELNQMIEAGALNPIFNSPAIYGSLSKSIKKSQIYKSIVPGKTGEKIAEGLDEYTGERKGFEKILNLMLSRGQFQIDMGGRMKALDLVGKPENVILNEKTESILSKISRRKYDKLLKSIDSKDFEEGEAQVDRIMSAIAKKGGQISLLDPGIFELGAGLAKKRTKGLSDLGYRDKFSFSGGFIPNFASSKFVQNIVDSYKASLTEKDPIRFNAAQKQEKYYNNVNSELKNLSASSGYNIEKLAYGLAALSGNTADSQARKALERIVNNKPYDDLVVIPNNVKKVKEMLTSSGSTEELKSILGKGAKTQNFAQSLLLLDKFSGFGNYKNPIGTPSVMDSWAIYVRNGGALKDKYDRGAVSASQKSKVFAQSKKGYNYYNKLVKEYGEAAEILGVPVRELQARTWGWARTQMGSRSRNDSFASGYVPNFSQSFEPNLNFLYGSGKDAVFFSPYDTLSSKFGGGPGYPEVTPGRSFASSATGPISTLNQNAMHIMSGGGQAFFSPVVNNKTLESLLGNRVFLETLFKEYPKASRSKLIETIINNPQQRFKNKEIASASESIISGIQKKLGRNKGVNAAREVARSIADPRFFGPEYKNLSSSLITEIVSNQGSIVAPNSSHRLYDKAALGGASKMSNPIELTKIFEGLIEPDFLSGLRNSYIPIGRRFDMGDSFSKKIGLVSKGYIPNFAGLSEAISREEIMSGLPASQIRAHFDQKGNPIAVTNKRDEPNGLKDVPNFAKISPASLKALSRLKNRKSPELVNPISASYELGALNIFTTILDQLAESEQIPSSVSTIAQQGAPVALGISNILKSLSSKGSKREKIVGAASGAVQAGGGFLLGKFASQDLDKRINTKKYEEAIDRSRKTFQDLTENTLELSNTLSKLDAAYKDPKADPKEIAKLVRTREDILRKVTIKNPELISRIASETSIPGKIDILEENQKEQQRRQFLKEEALAFSAKGKISGKEAPDALTSFFESVVNRANNDFFKQDFTGATPANFAEILKKGGLDIPELSKAFNSDELKKSFIDFAKLTKEVGDITEAQSKSIRTLSAPLSRARQEVSDKRDIRNEIKKALEEQLPELASFAGTFSKRAGISASSEASLALKRSEASVSFTNSLLSQLSEKEFTTGLSPEIKSRIENIGGPGAATGKELEAIQKLPGLNEAQVNGIQKLIDFNSQQTRTLQKANAIAEENKKIQLKFLSLQEKLSFGGDIRTSINPQMRGEAMAAGIRGPLTYQLGGLLGSRRTQVGGAVDFLTDTMQRYPGLLQSKDGKETPDVQAVKRELTGLNAMDMQRDLLKRAGMAQMMGLGGTSNLLRGKAFDQRYLLESAGLKADALFGSPEVPKDIRDMINEYERFNVESTKAAKKEDRFIKSKEEEISPAKESIIQEATKATKVLAEKFEASLRSTFGSTGITTSLMNVTAVGDVKFSQGTTPAKEGIPSSANGVTKYSSSILDAVNREKVALANRGIIGVPNFSMASINLEKSPDLVTPSNPQGFGVTNSIDEKKGLRSLGMRSSGFVPNYAMPSWMSMGNLDKARSIFTSADDAQSLVSNTKEGNVGGVAMDLAGPALDAAKFLAKGAAKKVGLGAASLGLDIGEYVVKPLSEKSGLTDYIADRMYGAYESTQKMVSSFSKGSGVTTPLVAYNKLGGDLTDPSPEWMKKGRVPNFAKSRMEELLERIYGPRADAPKPVVPSPPAPILGVSQKTMPFYPERLVNETYPYGSKPSMGNVNPTVKAQKSPPKRDPGTGRFLSKPQGDLMEKIEKGKLAKAAKKAQLAQGSPSGFSSFLPKPGLQQMLALTPEEQARIARGAFESSQRAGAAQMSAYQRTFLAQKASELQPSKPSTGLRLAERGSISTPLFTGKERGPRPMITLPGGKQPASPAGQLLGTIGQETGPRPKIILPGGQKPAGKIPKSSGGTQYSLLARGQGTSQSFIGAVNQTQQQNLLAQARSSFSSAAKAQTILSTGFSGASLAAPSAGVQPSYSGSTLQLAQKSNVKPSVSVPPLKQPQPGIINQTRSGLQLKGQGGYTTPFLVGKKPAQSGAPVTGKVTLAEYLARKEQMSIYEQALKEGEGRKSFRSDYEQSLRKAEKRGLTEDQIRKNILRKQPSLGIFQDAKPAILDDKLQQAFKSTSLDAKTYNAYKKAMASGDLDKAARIASGSQGQAPFSGIASRIKSGLSTTIGGRGAGGAQASGVLGKAASVGGTVLKGLGILGSVAFGGAKAAEAYEAAKEGRYGEATLAGASSAAGFASLIKGAGKVAGPAGVVLGGLSDVDRNLTLASDWKDIFGRKKEGESIGFGDVFGTAVGAATSLPATIGLLGYRTGNILENKLGLGNKLGDLAAGSRTARASYEAGVRPKGGMTVNQAVQSNQLVAKKSELLAELNKYNEISGNPLVSRDFQISASRRGQAFEEDQRIEALKKRLEEESKAVREGIASRATAAGAAETARLNKQSAAEEEARSSQLRRSFLESFDKNAEANGYLTTRDRANFLLEQEGKNGLGTFKPTDFKDAEFARSFSNYKAAREAEAARQADRSIPQSAIEFRNRPMPSFPQDVLEEATRTGRSAERVMQDRAGLGGGFMNEEEANLRRGAMTQGMTLPEINQQEARETGLPNFPKDVLEEAMRRRVTAEQVMQERASGKVPNFAAMSNNAMASGDVYSRMRMSAASASPSTYSQGYVPNFAATKDFSDAIIEAMRNGMTSAFPNGPSSSSVSNSNVINIDGRTSIQNAPDEAMQGIIGILFDKIPELKKLGPAALNFKR